MGDNIVKNIQAAKSAANLFWEYETTLSDVLEELRLDFSYSEIIDSIYQIPSDCDETERARQLKENLQARAMLHGTKAAVSGWVLFITEFYRLTKDLSKEDVQELFLRHGVYDFLANTYPALHTASEKLAVHKIDAYIEKRC